MKNNPKRNIYRSPRANKWRIQKTKDGKIYYFGSYHKLEDAMLIRDMLERINYGFNDDPMRNIGYDDRRSITKPWHLRKFRDGEYVYIGSFSTLEEAQEERDIMEAADWDFDLTNGAGDMSEDELRYGQVCYGGEYK